MKKISHSLEETEVIAKEWLEDLKKQTTGMNEAEVIGLSGHLGAGKTAFVKIIAKLLGVNEVVTSPTFVIMKLYPTNDSVFKQLVHIDAYRLEKQEDLGVLGLEKMIANKTNLVMVEWPENVGLIADHIIDMKSNEGGSIFKMDFA